MKNTFKKALGIMLATSIICTLMATGCVPSNSDKDKTTATENPTAEMTTATEQPTDESTFATEETATEEATAEQTTATEAQTAEEDTIQEQTLTDEVTGVQVTGKLPVGVELVTSTYIMSTVDFYDERLEPPYTVEGDYPKRTGSIEQYYDLCKERKTENIAKIMNNKDWAQWEGYAGGMINIQLYLVKDSKILESVPESELIVTMPYNYRRGLVTGGITGEARAINYDYDDKKFVKLELIPAESTAEGTFQFKTNSLGRFFIGGDTQITDIMNFYESM
ncbi:MAG: hypothetical protein II233_00520 [Clostridia bacterium]|nr:hypothetical protein [Clostridia bacterium]